MSLEAWKSKYAKLMVESGFPSTKRPTKDDGSLKGPFQNVFASFLRRASEFLTFHVSWCLCSALEFCTSGPSTAVLCLFEVNKRLNEWRLEQWSPALAAFHSEFCAVAPPFRPPLFSGSLSGEAINVSAKKNVFARKLPVVPCNTLACFVWES